MSRQPVPHPSNSESLMILQPVTHFAGGRGHQGLVHFRGRRSPWAIEFKASIDISFISVDDFEAVDLWKSRP